MIASIMQPTFIPWSGYFNLISKSDSFIFLDDVEYSKGSWHNRNFLYINEEPVRITLPVKKTSNKTLLNEVLINYKELNIRKIKFLFHQNFKNSKYFYLAEELINDLHEKKFYKLSDLNIHWIKKLSEVLKLKCNFFISSELEIISENRINRISKLLTKIKASHYLTVYGSKNYMELDNYKKNISQSIEFNKYECNYSINKKSNSNLPNASMLSIILDKNFISTC